MSVAPGHFLPTEAIPDMNDTASIRTLGILGESTVLTGRAYAALERAGVETIGALRALSRREMDRIVGLGPRGVEALRSRLRDNNLVKAGEEGARA